MALAIGYDGTGIVAYANGQTTDTGGGSWGELGAGTVGDNPDVYLYGANSFGSKYASKSGRTYYQDDGTINFSTTGDLVYMLVNIQSNGAFTLYNDGGTFQGPFNAIIGSSNANLSHWNIAAKGASNGWSGGWKAFVIDPTLATGTETEGTPSLTAINTYGVWIDTDVSVRADSIFQSMIIAAKGITFTGSPTVSSEGWDELAIWCTDYTNRAFPFLEVRGNTYFMKGSVLIGDGTTSTTFSASDNNIECEESSFYNGTAWVSSYPSDANHIATTANSSIDWTNVSISGYTANKLSLNTSVGNASTFKGGKIKVLSTLVGKATDSFNGVVFGQYDARTIGTEEYVTCTFDGASTMTVGATANFADNANIVNGVSGVSPLSVATLEYINGNTINSSGSNHSVTLTSIGDGAMDWNCVTTGFDAGVTGSPITPTNTGNETINITATTGTVSISVASGATTPSVKSAGAVVNVIAGLLPITVTVKDKDSGLGIPSANVIVKRADTKATIIVGTTNASGIYTESVAASYNGVAYVVWARQMDLVGDDYVQQEQSGTISTSGADINFSLEKE